MATVLPRPEEIAKMLGIKHVIYFAYDPISDRLKIRMQNWSRDRFASDFIDFPYTVEHLETKLEEMQTALEKE